MLSFFSNNKTFFQNHSPLLLPFYTSGSKLGGGGVLFVAFTFRKFNCSVEH